MIDPTTNQPTADGHLDSFRGGGKVDAGSTIGRYRILRLLGEGGMGAVYEAEQEQPRRTVALKVIKPGLAGSELLLRFDQESRALGRLQHPGIAQVYEAGTGDAGFGPQPYFAMEFIRGRSLLTFADEHHLNARQRLEIMAKVCEGVHHAHQRGLIHRDLKPGNILVDDSGQPKILDFGVARVTDSDGSATLSTHLGELVGTLAYMSPEQVLADPLELDTRSDVYALGVILYELLAGRPPYTVSRKLHEAVQTIREQEPAPLSSVTRAYRGDIETIVAKALEKDKTRRYASAADLASDLRRYLTDEPIEARPASTGYQLQKFARRHRALVAAATMVFFVLVAGIVASTWQAMRANRAGRAALLERNRAVAAEAQAVQERNRAVTEKDRADTESATAKAVSEFLQNDLLAQASAYEQARPDTKPDPDLKVRTALDRAAARIAGNFTAQPLVEASIRMTLGETYFNLGLYPEAQQHWNRAFDLRRRVLGEEHPNTLDSLNSLAILSSSQGQHDQADQLYTKVVRARRRVLGDEHPDTLASMSGLATVNWAQGRFAEAQALETKVLEAKRHALGEEHRDTLTSMNNLATLDLSLGKYAQAEPLFAKVLEIQHRVLGEEHPYTLVTMSNLATTYRIQGKNAQAETLFAKAVEIRRRVLGDEHPDTLTSLNNLGLLYRNQGQYARAEEVLTKVFEARRRVLGEEHPNTLQNMNNLGSVYREEGKSAQAEMLLAKVLEARRRVLGEEHSDTLSTVGALGLVYRDEGNLESAEALLTKALEVQRRALGEEHPETLASVNNLAGLYRIQRRYAQAEPLYRKALEGRRRVLGAEHPNTLASMNDLAGLYLDEGQYSAAETLLRQAGGGRRVEKIASESWGRFNTQSLLGASLSAQGKYAEAEPLLLSGYAGMMRRKATIPAPSRPALDQAGERIVQFYQNSGKPEKATEWREKLRMSEAGALGKP